jgi:hypothetical protein
MSENKQAHQCEEITQIPFNIFESRCYEYERRLDEQRKDYFEHIEAEKSDKQKTVKHWKQAVIVLAILVTLILGSIVGTAIYVFDNFDFLTFEQDGSGINNYAAYSEQGDLNNGAENNSN